MKTKKEQIELIIVRFLNKEAGLEDLTKLNFWLRNKKNIPIFNEFVKVHYLTTVHMDNFDVEKAKKSIKEKLKKSKRKTLAKKIYKISAAASIALLISVLVVHKKTINQISSTSQIVEQTIAPGTDKAVLTLENGEYIELEKGKNYQSKNRTSNGEQLVYNNEPDKPKETVQYNYLTIPKGGQFFLQLSDNTKVWLNSDTKLKYPIEFIEGRTREVELLYGEAYFEVSPSTQHKGASFVVNDQIQKIEVLGTQFNIRAYKDNPVHFTTLIEGKVNVSNHVAHKTLIPGEQSTISDNSSEIDVKKVDVDYEIAWKKGLFMFKKESLDDMLKTLSRWYDTEIIFQNEEKKNEVFSGILKRSDKLEDLLNILEKTGDVEFIVGDKKVIVK